MIKKGYDFDDLLLIPRISSANSREDVDLSVTLSEFLKLKIPIIASPMKGIVGPNLINKLSELGGMGILHRFQDASYSLGEEINDIKNSENYGVAVGLKDAFLVQKVLDFGSKLICIDVANGYLDSITRFCAVTKDYIIKNGYRCLLMAGNVATYQGVANLKNAGADLIRVGIGPGKLCTTRNVTGVGVPQLTAIQECGILDGVVADGGIRNSGDAVKALASGADVVMIGSLFAQCFESEHNGIIYGMASRRLQDEYYHSVKSIEGIEVPAEKRVSLEDFINEFTNGIKSGMTYLNARNLTELYTNAEFIETGTGSIKKI